MTVFLLVVLVFWLAVSLWHFVDLLQFFQLSEYLAGRFMLWSRGHLKRVVRPVEGIAALLMVAALLVPLFGRSWAVAIIVFAAWVGSAIYSLIKWRATRAKVIKPLVFTARVKRLLAAAILAWLVEAGMLFEIVFGASIWNVSAWPAFPEPRFFLFLFALWLIGQLTVVSIVLASLLTFPYEEALRFYYVQSARKVIRAVNPIVIGITGSYGKTSTKEILAHVLGSRYEVLKTPRTFNTIMGVCKIIREELKPRHKYFIVEMGAYKPGEIARICRLVHPRIGIITAIGPQHLERFKTLENIIRAKFELIEALPPDGVAVFNGDDPICARLAAQTSIKTLRYGLQSDTTALDLRVVDPQTGENGTTFDLVLEGQPPVTARTRLLGHHNVANTAGAVLVSLQCGVTLKEAAQALPSLAPLEHRLQLVRAPGDILYIDNAYNSNPSGAKIALEVLASFKNGRKILVTPGFIELGSIEAEEHARLGRNAAEVCDYIFLIGAPDRLAQIQKGIAEKSFAPDRVYCYNLLNDARPALRDLLKPGDVVLFENDLPDTYS